MRGPLRRAIRLLGPGIITGASDDDPTAIVTFSQAGAQYGFTTLWITTLSFPLMSAVQYTCSKIALATGQDLATILRRHTHRGIFYPIVAALLLANGVTAAADLGAIATGFQLLMPVPFAITTVVAAGLIVILLVWGRFHTIEAVFKWLTLTLLAYVGAALLARPDLHQVARGTFVPTVHLNSQFISVVVAMLGTNLSPYLFFWQATEETEDIRGPMGMTGRFLRKTQINSKEFRYARWDTTFGMFFSNLVVYSVNVAAAATLFKLGIHDVTSPEQAAHALEPIAGKAARALFALGLIGSGFLSVPVLLGASGYIVSNFFGWPGSLEARCRDTKRFYAVIIGMAVIAVALNFIGLNPMKALVWAAAANGLVAPPVFALTLWIANRHDIMGPHTNGRLTNLLDGAAALLMTAAAIGLFLTWGKS